MLGGAFVLRKYAGFLSKVAKYGFYIILFLCISAIGISGYVMYVANNTAKNVREEAESGNSIEIPFPTDYRSVYNPAEILEETQKVINETEIPKPQEEVKKEEKKEIKEEKTPPKSEKVVYTMALSGSVSVPFSGEELIKSKTMDDWRIHEGVDIKGEQGKEVLAIADGVVEAVENDTMLGNTVKISHTNGLRSIYANLSDEIKVKKGASVKAGDVVGSVGASAITECMEEPHLHLEVIADGKHIDPLSLFPAGEE